jgi:hypothetical protein
MGSIGSELREFLYLKSPALIISEMKMEDADLVVSQKIDELKNIVFGSEVPGNIEHESAISQVRPVFDDQIGKLVSAGITSEIVESNLCIECTILVCSLDLALSVKDYAIPSRLG